MTSPPHKLLRLGACSWTAKGWAQSFYPEGCKPADYIAAYALRYDSVEIDATFYGLPKPDTIERWREITPPGFCFAAKAPRTITHDKCLEDCREDLLAFLRAMSLLGDKLGPLLLQFPYFAKRTGVTCDGFCGRLEAFLPLLPREGFSFAVEVRNKQWLEPRLLELLREHGVAAALIDHPWMAPPDVLFKTPGIITAPFTYLRWLGDRHGIEKITKVFDKQVIDQRQRLDQWLPHIKHLLDQQVRVHGYVNNHYGGHAPAEIDYLAEKLASDY